MKPKRIETIIHALREAFDESMTNAQAMEVIIACADLSIEIANHDLRKALVDLVYEMNADLQIEVGVKHYEPQVITTDEEMFFIPETY
jgi:hypothetical protein